MPWQLALAGPIHDLATSIADITFAYYIKVVKLERLTQTHRTRRNITLPGAHPDKKHIALFVVGLFLNHVSGN